MCISNVLSVLYVGCSLCSSSSALCSLIMFPSYLYCPPVSYPYFYPSIVFFSSLLSSGLISLFLSLYCLILTSIVLRSHIPISSPLLSSYYLYCPPVSNPYFYPSIVFSLYLLSPY